MPVQTTSHSQHSMLPHDDPPVIELSGFTKIYDGFTAVHDLNFRVAPGEIVGLVGANGAGKTTTLRAIAGILRPTQGTVRVGGHDIESSPLAAKRLLAYIPDTVHPYDLLTVTEHLHFIALAYRVPNALAKYDALLEELELASKKDEVASTLSRGMLQKLSLACAFLREPGVIVLDEPLTGLDPRGIRNIKQSIRRRAEAGTAFLLSSHLLELVEALADKVLILHQGKKLAFGTLEAVRSSATLHGQAKLEDVFFAITEKSYALAPETAAEKTALGSTGYQPVPSGNLPDRTGVTSMNKAGAELTAPPAPVPVGRLPTGAGKLPAPPRLQTGSETGPEGSFQ